MCVVPSWFGIFFINIPESISTELNKVTSHNPLSSLLLWMLWIGIIIEFMDRGSLEFMLDDNLEVSEDVMAAIVYQVLWGLGYLHYDNRLVRTVDRWLSAE